MAGIAAMLVPRMWRYGNLDTMCKAASLCSGVTVIISGITMDALGGVSLDLQPTFSWVLDLIFGGVFAMAVLWIPHVTTKALLTRAIRRRFDALREGDRVRLGDFADEAVLVSRLDGSGGALHVFIATRGPFTPVGTLL